MAAPPVAPAGRLNGLRAGGDARRWAVDGVLAAAVALVQVGGGAALDVHRDRPLSAAGLTLLGLGAAALVGRRRFPVAVLATSYALAFAYVATQGHTGPAWIAVAVAFGTAISLRKRAAAVALLIAGYAGFLWGPMLAGRRGPSAPFAFGLGAGLALLLAVSEWIRLRRQRERALSQRRDEEARRRASDERLRMARDVHDVVAHDISLIRVQANTALHLMDRQPERARAALTTINDVSKQALVDLRAILGVLRRVDDDAPRSPTPGLGELPDLLDTASAAGLDVRLAVHGDPRPVPTDVGVAAYRIAQEALTNTARHSGSTTAQVSVSFRPLDLVVQVDDAGNCAIAPPTRQNGAGSGITGMTERARALGGTLEASPRPDGGFRVRARLPTTG